MVMFLECMTKHDYDDLDHRGFTYTLQDLGKYVSNFNKPKEMKAKIPTTTDLYCAKALYEEFKNMSLDFAKWLYDYFLGIDELFYCKVIL
jgi:hypothetical protein